MAKTQELLCGDCGFPMVLRNSKFGLRYECVWYGISCHGTHTAHQKTGLPMGVPANAEVRRLRMRVHDLFDRRWKSGSMTRQGAYHWLAAKMMMNYKRCHIGSFDKNQCLRALEILQTHED
jgi:hypothetical protein